MLVEAGVDPKTIMEIVGHDDSKTTLKVYTHVTKKMKKMPPRKSKSTSVTSLIPNKCRECDFIVIFCCG